MAPEGNTCATGCQSATDCPTNRCSPSLDARSEGSRLRLTCTQPQGDRYAAETCSDDRACRTGLCFEDHCSTPCGTCPTEFGCHPGTISRGGVSLDHGVCSWWPEQPVLELGAVSTTEVGARTLEFTLPAGFGAFTLVLEAADDSVPAVTGLVAPDGTVLLGRPRTDAGVSSDLARCSSSPGTATVLVPGSDLAAAAPQPGRYQLEIVSYEASGFPLMPRQRAAQVDRVAVLMKRPARGGVVDLTLQVAPETGYSVADGGGTFVRGLLARFEQLTREKLGVGLGAVVLTSLPADAGYQIDTVAQSRALWAAHSIGAARTRPINVMLVRTLSFAGGVAGAVPGAPGVYGRGVSGVTVAPLASGPTTTGVLLTHEVGHFLGLSHTSDEFFGPDLISDTPACANPAGNGCPDARNLMFPYFPTRDPLGLTAGQARVLEGSPWVYRRLHPGACGAADVVGLTESGYSGGSTEGGLSTLVGTCGGAGAERVHLFRLEATATKLEARVTATGFVPVLYARRGECGPAAVEVACALGDAGSASVSLDNPQPGAFFLVVDSAGDAGVYDLSVTVTR